MNVFPADIAEDVTSCAMAAGWHASYSRKGKKGDSGASEVAFHDYVRAFTKKSAELLSAETCDNIKWMFWHAAWQVVNTLWRRRNEAEEGGLKVTERYQKICAKKELSETLASDLKELGLSAAAFCANSVCDYKDEIMIENAKFKSFSAKIAGPVNLVEVKFFAEKAKVLQKAPVVLTEETMNNGGDIEQSYTFSYSSTSGKTSSWSNTLGFKFGVMNKFEAGFFFLAEMEFKLSLEVSETLNFSGSSSSTISKSYTFPLKVPKHSSYKVKATVHEAEMVVPYEMVFDFDGTQKSISGTWQGVATSAVTCDITKV